jgi:RNA polymerase sigma factor (TIGR02999 family)
MANEKPGQTLQPTALVHEAWLRLLGPEREQHSWEGRSHFLAVAAEAMRRILVDRARRKARPKHGGDLHRADIQDIEIADELPPERLLALDEALTEFTTVDSQAAELVKLRFFAGFTQEQAAKGLGISRSTADRNWAFARAWLSKSIDESLSSD